MVDEESVLGDRPVVAGPGTTPRLNEIAFLIELHDPWSRLATNRDGRILRRAQLVRSQAPRTVKDPDVIARVDR